MRGSLGVHVCRRQYRLSLASSSTSSIRSVSSHVCLCISHAICSPEDLSWLVAVTTSPRSHTATLSVARLNFVCAVADVPYRRPARPTSVSPSSAPSRRPLTPRTPSPPLSTFLLRAPPTPSLRLSRMRSPSLSPSLRAFPSVTSSRSTTPFARRASRV